MLYLLAAFESPERVDGDHGLSGMVAPEDRITAVRDDGALVVLDETSGELSEVVATDLGVSDGPVPLAVDERHETAYVQHGEAGEARIRLVHLRSGRHQPQADGTAPAVARIQHTGLPRTRQGRAVEQIAYTADGHQLAVIVENLTTGAQQRFSAREDSAAPFASVGALAWDPFVPVLYIAGPDPDGRWGLWRFDVDRQRHLDDAEALVPPGAGSDVVGVAALSDELIAIEESPDGTTRLIRLDRRTGAPVGPVAGDLPPGIRWIDADPALRQLLLVTADGDLYRWDGTADEPLVRLAGGVRSAAW